VLAGLRQESLVFCHAELTAPWGFAKAQLEGAPFHAVTRGQAWVKLADETIFRELGAGDFIVLPHGDAHRLCGAPDAETVSFTEILAQQNSTLWQPGRHFGGPVRLAYGGGGAVTTLVSGVFAFADRHRNPLVALLPRVIHIRAEEGKKLPWLDTTLQYLAQEAAAAQPGAQAVTAKLADILLIQAIRAYLAVQPTEHKGWLRGMADPHVALALALIHHQPSAPWTVATLAARIGVSRSGFAARFKSYVGQSPIEYLTQWRMYQAAGQLVSGKATLVDIAEVAGYTSEVAFSKAFKRWAGMAPAAYRRSDLRASEEQKV